jgi:hypothetical protein
MKRKSQPWERADHWFGIATFALIGFMVIAGFGAWILGDKPITAASSVHADEKAQ